MGSSSQAGSSGWSSSAGVSSLNTNSVDEGYDPSVVGPGAGSAPANPRAHGHADHHQVTTLAAIGPANAAQNRAPIGGGGPRERGGRANANTNTNANDNASSLVAARSVPVGAALGLGEDSSTLGSTLGSLSPPYRRAGPEGSGHDHDNDVVSRADLDSAIEAGDWAAVGATAALLASASETGSLRSAGDDDDRSFSAEYSSPSLGGGLSGRRRRNSDTGDASSTKSDVSSLDARRTAELDHLVDAGDWEGVVLAAREFEASGERRGGSPASDDADPDQDARRDRAGGDASSLLSLSGRSHHSASAASTYGTDARSYAETGTSSMYTHSVNTSVSESPSRAQKRAEIRTEVEALVRRVVPDEIDNVDEMMVQFHGREEELLETLRTMQERSIAQRARAAVHKTAKREAKRTVMKERAAGLPPRAPGAAGEKALALAHAEAAHQPRQTKANSAKAANAATATAAAAVTVETWRGRTEREEDPSGSPPRTIPRGTSIESSYDGTGGGGAAAGTGARQSGWVRTEPRRPSRSPLARGRRRLPPTPPQCRRCAVPRGPLWSSPLRPRIGRPWGRPLP